VDHIGKGRATLAEPAPERTTPAAAADGRPHFERLFRDHYPAMVRLAHLLGSDDPENAAQEAFTRLHSRLPRLAEPDRAVGYLRACLVNITRSRHTHLAVVARHPPAPAIDVPSAESTVMDRADQALIIAALRRLSPRHREALVLRYWLELSEKQMAEAMGTSVGTVKSHVSRGLSALRLALPPAEGEL
jgi:RNA polymerase sigma factor (sigma-70 family)